MGGMSIARRAGGGMKGGDGIETSASTVGYTGGFMEDEPSVPCVLSGFVR